MNGRIRAEGNAHDSGRPRDSGLHRARRRLRQPARGGAEPCGGTGGKVGSWSLRVGPGLEEREASGGAAVGPGSLLGRQVTIPQGKGWVLYARPAEPGYVEIGGRVVEDG